MHKYYSLVLLLSSMAVCADQQLNEKTENLNKYSGMVEIGDTELTSISGQTGNPEALQKDIDSSVIQPSKIENAPTLMPNSGLEIKPNVEVVFNGQLL